MTQEEFHKRYQYNPNTDCLGEGGFGKVFKAYDNHRDRWVAIKMAEVKPQLEEVRLKKEVEMIKKLPTHPNIAYYEECYTFSTFAGEYDFGILQYYEQGNLQELLIANQLTDRQKDSLLRQILEGIGFLHSQGIIHRDIKPQNILIVNRNGEYVPKITDFGISKRLDTNKSSVFTNSIAGAGTLAYASPEQLLGQTIKKNTDLWSFGVIVYWVFLGKLPFNTGDMTVSSEAGRIELFKQITKGEIPGLVNQLNSPWNEIVKQCLVADNEKRIVNTSECLLLLGGMAFLKNETTNIIEKPTKKKEPNEARVEEEKTKINSFYKLAYSIIVILIIVAFALIWEYYVSDNKEIKKSESKQMTRDIGEIMDIDGNKYNVVVIGSQTWMVENLKTTRYNDGTTIPTIKESTQWRESYSGACCIYDNNEEYIARYGRLYNLHAIKTGKLAPTGWHIPSLHEWKTLENFLVEKGYNYHTGNSEIISLNLPEIAKSLSSSSGWNWSDIKGAIGNADYPEYRNTTGFSALAGGFRRPDGEYRGFGEEGRWCVADYRSCFKLRSDCSYSNYAIFASFDKLINPENFGISVRCIKNN